MTAIANHTITGTARVDRRTKNLIPRLRPGEIAIIDHRDLDGLSASGLIERRAGAVVNASASISGRYPNRGPWMLLQAGIPLLDVSEPDIISLVREGQPVELEEAGLRCGEKLFPGAWLEPEAVARALEEARSFMGAEIEAFARNTLEYIERERDLVLDHLEIPDLRTPVANRHAVVVVRGEGYKRDLEAILPYVREVRPVLIAVDGGADALLEYDLKPDLIVGDMDSVSDQALSCGAEIVVHSYPTHHKAHRSVHPTTSEQHLEPPHPSPIQNLESKNQNPESKIQNPKSKIENPGVQRSNGSAPGLTRLQSLGLEAKIFSVAGTSEDMAMLIAYEKGAELIVAVGTHFSLVDFLDKGRSGMASTFLVRLRVGSRLVDARGVGALYGTGSGLGYVWLLFLAAAFPIGAIAFLSPGLKTFLSLWLKMHGL